METVRYLLRLSVASRLVKIQTPSTSSIFLSFFLSFFSLRPSCSLLHRNLDVIFGILCLVSTPPWMRGLEDSRGVPRFYLSRRMAVREAVPPCDVLHEDEYFHGEPDCCSRSCCPLPDPAIVCGSRCSALSTSSKTYQISKGPVWSGGDLLNKMKINY